MLANGKHTQKPNVDLLNKQQLISNELLVIVKNTPDLIAGKTTFFIIVAFAFILFDC